MKKWGLFIIVVLLLAVACIYLFIPSTLTIAKVVPARCRSSAVFSVIGGDSGRGRWLPVGDGGFQYHVAAVYYNGVDISILTPQRRELISRLSIIPIGKQDSSLLHWECQLPAGVNPIGRVRRYAEAKEIAGNMKDVLNKLSDFLGKKENIYGTAIRESSTTDTFLVVTKSVYPVYPSTRDVYDLLDKLKGYIEHKGAREAGYPMMNVTKSGDLKAPFHLMVAIPIDRPLGGEGSISFMRLVPGKYLVTEVSGGETSIHRALDGLQRYITDYQRTVMAIPFQSLITDRSRQPDTSQWKTRIYYPIF
jgi:hypothetical protein